MNRIKKGDIVEVISGDDKGMRGEVLRVLLKQNRVVVSKVNMITKHQSSQRAGRSQAQGGRIKFEAPIHVSKVMLVSPKDNMPTRVGFEIVDGKKVRVARRTGDVID
jgi:large subunit ribosomal protein L24